MGFNSNISKDLYLDLHVIKIYDNLATLIISPQVRDRRF